MGGASGKGVEIPEKAAIKSEWAEWQTRLAEQQANAETDPRPGKDDEDGHDADYDYHSGWPRDPSLKGLVVQGGAPPRSNASSTKSGAPIGPRLPHGPAAMAGNSLIVHPARDRGAVKLPCTELPGHAPATGRGARRSRMPARAPPATSG